MATALRLLRTGTKKRPVYRMVVIDQARANKGAIIENLGMVPVLRAADVPQLNVERVKHWVSVGSIVSESAKTVLKKTGLYVAPPASKPKPAKKAKDAAPAGAKAAKAPKAAKAKKA
jgi:small subunit ribosomal protein S16